MQFLQNISLKEFLTMKVEVEAKKVVKIFSEEDLIQLWNVYRQELQNALIIGGGSNLVLTSNIDRLVILNELGGIQVQQKNNTVLVSVGAGMPWHEFINFCLQNNYGGVENLVSIPGKVGAAPMQNIGAYGVEVKDTIQRVKVFNLIDGKFEWISNVDCHFGYRESIFKNTSKGKYLIVLVEFLLTTKNHQLHIGYGDVQKKLEEKNIISPTIQDIASVIAEIRNSKLPDPNILPNCGSFFKNPIVPKNILEALLKDHPDIPHYLINEDSVKIPAGWLIEKSGWKGFKKNAVGIHDKQALVIVNYDNASGNEILEFSKMIQDDIHKKFGITLEREVNFV